MCGDLMVDEKTEDKNHNDETQVTFFKTPLWYLQLRARVLKFNERIIWITFLPFIAAAILLVGVNIIITIEFYPLFINGILYIVFLIVFIIIFWKFIIGDTWLNRFESFAYYAGAVGLDLDRIIVDENLYINPAYSINSLSSYCWWVSRKYKSNEKLLESLNKFSGNIDKIHILLKDPKKNKNKLENISKKLLNLGHSIFLNKEVNKNRIDEVLKELADILKPSRKEKVKTISKSMLSLFEKSTILKGIVYIPIDLGIAYAIICIGSMQEGVSEDAAFQAAVGAFILLLVFILNALRKSKQQ